MNLSTENASVFPRQTTVPEAQEMLYEHFAVIRSANAEVRL
jgi:hypothetical protein